MPFQRVQHCFKKLRDSSSLRGFPSTYAIVLLDMCILNRHQLMQYVLKKKDGK